MTEHIETSTQTNPTAEYEPLKVDFTPTPAVVPLVAWTWNTPVIPQFYWNVYSAEQRIKQICLEIGRIQEYLNYFAAHYNKMSGYLNKRIDKLTAAMYAEVERLDKAIEEENKARKLADELLQKGLDAEIARAKAAEIVLQQNIDANTTLIEDEEKRAKDAEEKLTNDLHDETAARVAEDKKISNTVETNRQHAEEVDAQLFDSIRTEANLRKNADNLLSDRIDKETEERKVDDASINTRIDNEHAERVKADNELDKRVTDNQQAVEHEVERAKSAENNLNDALEREIDARIDTDRSLENSIDANDRASKERDNKLQGNIDAEITNRGNAENAINDRITNEINDRKADNTSINTRIDKEAEERKNDVLSLNTRADNEQTERVKADNALDKRVTDNTQAIEHETERAKSAETNLNDALEREVDARQDDTRNLENQIDKVSTDSAKRDGVLQANIDVEAEKRATEDNKKVTTTNIKAAENSRITVTTANENTENATVTIGDTFDADFTKVNNNIEAEKQRAIAKENELSGKVEHETQERQSETTALNTEVAKRPTLDKFIAGNNITLTPDVDKTTLTISAKNSDISDEDFENKLYKNSTIIGMQAELSETLHTKDIPVHITTGLHAHKKFDNTNKVLSISTDKTEIKTDDDSMYVKESYNNDTLTNTYTIGLSNIPNKLTMSNPILPDEMTNFNQHVRNTPTIRDIKNNEFTPDKLNRALTAGDNISIELTSTEPNRVKISATGGTDFTKTQDYSNLKNSIEKNLHSINDLQTLAEHANNEAINAIKGITFKSDDDFITAEKTGDNDNTVLTVGLNSTVAHKLANISQVTSRGSFEQSMHIMNETFNPYESKIFVIKNTQNMKMFMMQPVFMLKNNMQLEVHIAESDALHYICYRLPTDNDLHIIIKNTSDNEISVEMHFGFAYINSKSE